MLPYASVLQNTSIVEIFGKCGGRGDLHLIHILRLHHKTKKSAGGRSFCLMVGFGRRYGI